jgi:hypothetical protein
MGHRDLARCVPSRWELQDVGSPVLLPLEWAKIIGSSADPIFGKVCGRCLEQAGFQACLPLCGFT